MFDFLYELYWRYYSSLSILPGLELLPDELLLEILSYVSISDLFYGWLNLNWRFNAIIYSLPIRAFYTVPKRSRWDHWWYSWKNSSDVVEPLRYFASQVISLQIDQCLSSYMINEINIIDYSHLRILKLCQPNTTQLDAIQAHNFPHLEHLSLVETKNFSLTVLCQFKSLRSCELQSLEIDAKYSDLLSSIQSLSLRQCDPWDMAIFLRHFPQMIFFKVFMFLSNSFVHKWNPIVDFVHPNLKSLDIYFVNLDSCMNGTDNGKSNSVTELLTSISSGKRIRYRLTLVDTTNFNFEQLQHAILKLDFVRFSCRLMWLHKYQPLPNIDCIRQVPLFNQLKIIHANSIVTLCRSIWTNTSISSH